MNFAVGVLKQILAAIKDLKGFDYARQLTVIINNQDTQITLMKQQNDLLTQMLNAGQPGPPTAVKIDWAINH